ncbi:hypothetical protein QJ857_gp1045 [Tupanvirus soda lake]|uniref:Band 7 domain-containing protein n=2 Tax=Tupanvirus TaxID=2094720 RepID=A0A6N1NJM2_9VIRU|nr:hypothetical protein QJ857_gp1045 [Tupanvirus soda lake]QKU35009.1 hypothetical protein [Tupanvirus soda lake]
MLRPTLKSAFKPTQTTSSVLPYMTNKRTLFTIVPAYKQGIRLNFGKMASEIKPGIRLNIPFYHQIYTLDTREKVDTIPTMQVISADNVTYKVDASVQYKIVDTTKALLNVRNVENALMERCKMDLRDNLSSMTINDVLEKKSEISKSVLDTMSKIKENWGIEVSTIKIKDLEFDESMKRSMSTIAEATRQAEAKVINAKADIETAKQYNEAAKIYSENPMTVRLREFQLWNSVSKNPGSTIYVVPSNLMDFLGKSKEK